MSHKLGAGQAVSKGYLKKNLFKEVRPLPEESKLPVVIERDELTGIRDLLPRWARRTCDFLLMTGVCRDDAVNLYWEHVNLIEGTFDLKSHGDYHPKNRHERTQPICPEVIALLKEIREEQLADGIESPLVFVDDKGKPILPDRLTKEFREARKVVTTRPVTIHALRRTFATMLEHNRVNPNTIKGLLGHKSLRTTERYLRTFLGEAAQAVQKISLSEFILPPV